MVLLDVEVAEASEQPTGGMFPVVLPVRNATLRDADQCGDFLRLQAEVEANVAQELLEGQSLATRLRCATKGAWAEGKQCPSGRGGWPSSIKSLGYEPYETHRPQVRSWGPLRPF